MGLSTKENKPNRGRKPTGLTLGLLLLASGLDPGGLGFLLLALGLDPRGLGFLLPALDLDSRSLGRTGSLFL